MSEPTPWDDQLSQFFADYRAGVERRQDLLDSLVMVPPSIYGQMVDMFPELTIQPLNGLAGETVYILPAATRKLFEIEEPNIDRSSQLNQQNELHTPRLPGH